MRGAVSQALQRHLINHAEDPMGVAGHLQLEAVRSPAYKETTQARRCKQTRTPTQRMRTKPHTPCPSLPSPHPVTHTRQPSRTAPGPATQVSSPRLNTHTRPQQTLLRSKPHRPPHPQPKAREETHARRHTQPTH